MGIETDEKQKKDKKERLQNVAIAVLSVIFSCVLVYSLFFENIKVVQSSMSPTIESGQVVVIRKTKDVSRGDIVVFFDKNVDENMIIKRVAAVGGDRIKIDENGVLTIKYTDESGEEKTITSVEDYIKDGENIVLEETYIDNGYIYLLGDNRLISYDSSEFGEVLQKNVVGKVVLILK